MLQQVADEHRRDLLGQDDRWRLLHRQTARSSRTVRAGWWGRFRFGRRRPPVPGVATAVPTVATAVPAVATAGHGAPPATATYYAC